MSPTTKPESTPAYSGWPDEELGRIKGKVLDLYRDGQTPRLDTCAQGQRKTDASP